MDIPLHRRNSGCPYLWRLDRKIAALHSGDRCGGGDNSHTRPGDRSADPGGTVHPRDTVRGTDRNRERCPQRTGVGAWLGTPLALLALTGTRNPVRYILAATRWALCGPDRRSLGGQAPLQMEKQSDTASGDRRSVGPAHPDDRLAPVGGVQQPLGERFPRPAGVCRGGSLLLLHRSRTGVGPRLSVLDYTVLRRRLHRGRARCPAARLATVRHVPR